MKDEKDEDSNLDPQTQADQLEERLIDLPFELLSFQTDFLKLQQANTSRDRFLGVALRRLRIMVKRGALKVEQTSYTNLELFLRSLTKHLFGYG